MAIDGSKFKALNSKKRNFNQQKLKKKIKEIEEKIEDYFKDLEENDVKELSCSPRGAGQPFEYILTVVPLLGLQRS